MRSARNELPIMLEAGAASVRGAQWGDQRVVLVSVPAGTDFGSRPQGLPGNRCPCPHWGYVIKGCLRIQYGDGTQETLRGGDLYYMPPGHTRVAEEDTDFVEIAPPEEHQRFLDRARRNLARAA